jgi:hypothetical protein
MIREPFKDELRLLRCTFGFPVETLSAGIKNGKGDKPPKVACLATTLIGTDDNRQTASKIWVTISDLRNT